MELKKGITRHFQITNHPMLQVMDMISFKGRNSC